MNSLLSVALKNLLSLKKIEQNEHHHFNEFLSFTHVADQNEVLLYSKNIIDINNEKWCHFDEIFKKTAEIHCHINQVFDPPSDTQKENDLFIYLPIKYVGESKTRLLKGVKVPFYVLLEGIVKNNEIYFNLYSMDSYGPDDQFANITDKLKQHFNFLGDEKLAHLAVNPVYLSHQDSESRVKCAVWLMVYAAKLIERKDRLANDGKTISSFRADALFNLETAEKYTAVVSHHQDKDQTKAWQASGTAIKRDNYNPSEALWKGDWEIHQNFATEETVPHRKAAPLTVNYTVSKIQSGDNSMVGNTTNPIKKEMEIPHRDVDHNVKHPGHELQAIHISAPALHLFRRDMDRVVVKIKAHIEELIKANASTLMDDKNNMLQQDKINALNYICVAIQASPLIEGIEIEKAVRQAMQKYPNCRDGGWMGGLFRSRTGSIIDELMRVLANYDVQFERDNQFRLI